LNEDAKKYANIDLNFNEVQVGDFFAKGVRPKIETTFAIWNKTNSEIVNSDLKALDLAKQLCLLPMPGGVRELILKNLS
jgi:hypothetical protein